MDFAAYASPYPDSSPAYSESSSTPRTPSPQSVDLIPTHNFKHPIPTVPTIFQEDSYLPSDVGSMIQNDSWVSQANYNNYPAPQGSLLRELYEPEPYQSEAYIDDHAHYNEWQHQQQQQQHHHQQHQQMHLRQPDHHTLRRATFPYVRHDFPQHHIPHHPQFYDQYPSMYNDSLSMSPDPSESRHPHDPQSIKLEDTPLIVPSQLGFAAHTLHGHHHPGFLPSGAGASVPIQHTDDAASKETQYLRRRCFNCHTTEPPSWRRSTLNPGKIVCNKCGLYERTHLRPRPLRFDELRAGGKTRKPGEKKVQKPAPLAGSPQIKKEPREFGMARRSSVSSTASSGGAVSDWDDNVSVYSSQPPTPGSISGPPSSYSSPSIATFPIPRSSQSPPIDAGPQGPIRLPNAPLTDIASLQQQAPRKSATAPGYFPQPPVSYQGQEMLRRGSMPRHCEQPRQVQFASPQIPTQSLAPLQGPTSEAPAEKSPQIAQMQILSPQMITSSPVPATAEPPSS
ncbi:uncharacterized protein F5147DRAFT_833995 [Suillus discolor]|uniref:GATA-type domain-containing protein n=1 Tax=Suillus discolor TaxID=1912936 RepID=A0A9P7FGX2_9AGAM|nr:uncharacterized protein F5147DRAFT_833995 [Suillus discolor]KAG2115865.1 hypothetical protein F5147DRAFT_833995 [Suillus discolor]